jgi:hypothetical protein
MSMPATRQDEWLGVRIGLLAASALVALSFVSWGVETASTDEPSRLAETHLCLQREKLLTVEPAKRDPIAARAREGALATRIEGNGVHILLTRSQREAKRLADAYARIGGELTGRLEVRGRIVYLWEGPSTPTQRQTVYDCAY